VLRMRHCSIQLNFIILAVLVVIGVSSIQHFRSSSDRKCPNYGSMEMTLRRQIVVDNQSK